MKRNDKDNTKISLGLNVKIKRYNIGLPVS